MRIIAGKAKSLPLTAPAGANTRPTTDRIKETLFNMIQLQLPEAYFLDLFAGSGGIGLEAVSRGAAHAVFVEQDQKAADCIKKNIAFTKFENQCTLLHMDVMSALHRLGGSPQAFDIIFLDPPYEQSLEKEVLNYLKNAAFLHADTMIIIEAALHTDLSYIKEMGFLITKEKKYKTSEHFFLKRSLQEEKVEKSDLSRKL